MPQRTRLQLLRSQYYRLPTTVHRLPSTDYRLLSAVYRLPPVVKSGDTAIERRKSIARSASVSDSATFFRSSRPVTLFAYGPLLRNQL